MWVGEAFQQRRRSRNKVVLREPEAGKNDNVNFMVDLNFWNGWLGWCSGNTSAYEVEDVNSILALSKLTQIFLLVRVTKSSLGEKLNQTGG